MTHGGVREGTGRKRKLEPEVTTEKNVPKSLADDRTLDEFIQQVVALKLAGLYREGMPPAQVSQAYSDYTKL